MQLTDLAFPAAWREGARSIAEVIKNNDRFIVSAHVRPDGDAVSALAAMGYFLKALHKEFVLYSSSGVPAYLSFMKLPGHVHDTLGHLPFRPETLIALDCGEPMRLGEELEAAISSFACINVDHHPGPGMGTLANLIRPDACATAHLVAAVIEASGEPMTSDMAQSLALGIITDTGGFRHENLNENVFAVSAYLSSRGANIFRIREHLDKNWTLGRLKLWSILADRVSLLEGGRLAFCEVTADDFRKTGTGAEDCEGFVERLREIKGVEVSCFVREATPRLTKFSLRSADEADVRAIAQRLGGGGHVRAAGGTTKTGLEDTSRELKRIIADALAQAK